MNTCFGTELNNRGKTQVTKSHLVLNLHMIGGERGMIFFCDQLRRENSKTNAILDHFGHSAEICVNQLSEFRESKRVSYLVTQENLKILRKLNRNAKDATLHCALLSVYRKGIIHKINTKPNQSNRFIHSLKYECRSLLKDNDKKECFRDWQCLQLTGS